VRIKLHRPWLPEDDEQLRGLAGITPLRAAAKLKRTLKSVEARAIVLDVPLKSPRDPRGDIKRKPASRPSA
jgi:hypothetical protein